MGHDMNSWGRVEDSSTWGHTGLRISKTRLGIEAGREREREIDIHVCIHLRRRLNLLVVSRE